MAAPMTSRNQEVTECLNEARNLHLLSAGDRDAINEVIMDYFTSRDVVDSDDDDFDAEEDVSDIEINAHDMHDNDVNNGNVLVHNHDQAHRSDSDGDVDMVDMQYNNQG